MEVFRLDSPPVCCVNYDWQHAVTKSTPPVNMPNQACNLLQLTACMQPIKLPQLIKPRRVHAVHYSCTLVLPFWPLRPILTYKNPGRPAPPSDPSISPRSDRLIEAGRVNAPLSAARFLLPILTQRSIVDYDDWWARQVLPLAGLEILGWTAPGASRGLLRADRGVRRGRTRTDSQTHAHPFWAPSSR